MINTANIGNIFKLARREWIRIDLMAAIIGIFAGYGAIFFRLLISFFHNLFYTGEINFSSNLSFYNQSFLCVFIPAFGILIAAWLANTFAPEAKGHGVPEVMEAQTVRGGRIRGIVVIIKSLASSITIASGGSVGREGPIVQIGAAASSYLGQIFNQPSRVLRILVGCGVAASIAATFNTPIGGVIFAIELILLELSTNSFIPLVISSVFATIVSHIHLGNRPSFLVPSYTLTSPYELSFYLGLGIISGMVGVLFIYMVYSFEDLFEKLRTHYLFKAFAGGLLIGVIGLFFPEVLGVGYQGVQSALNASADISRMLPLTILKIIAVSLTLGVGGSGGIFAPSLFIGAMLGGSYGYFIHQIFPDATANYGAYALVGMAALFSAASRATFTAIVILFEMTLDYSIILPLMFSCVLADRISSRLSAHSIYSLKLARKGVPFAHDITANVYALTPISEIMTTKVVKFPKDISLKEARDIFMKNPHTIFPVVDEEERFLGAIRASNIRKAITEQGEDAPVTTIPFEEVSISAPNESVAQSIEKMRGTRDPRIIVIERETGKLVGIAGPKDILKLEKIVK